MGTLLPSDPESDLLDLSRTGWTDGTHLRTSMSTFAMVTVSAPDASNFPSSCFPLSTCASLPTPVPHLADFVPLVDT